MRSSTFNETSSSRYAGHQPRAHWVADGFLDEAGRRLAWSRANRHLLE
ncbi:hypothetical protein [Streptosporangium sp. NPDC020145]